MGSIEMSRNKTKILFLIGTLHNGGAERALLNLIKALDKERYDLTVMTVLDEGSLIPAVKKYANYASIYQRNISNQQDYLECIKRNEYLQKLSIENLYREVINKDFDIEVAFLEDTSTKLIAHSLNSHSRKIAWIHNDFSVHMDSLNYYDDFEEQRECYDKFDDIVCVSNKAKEGFIKRFGRTANVKVLYNLVDREHILTKSNEALMLNLNKKFKICSVGRLVPQKGFDRLLEVHKQLTKEGFDYELWIIGEGHQRPQLEKFVQENHLENSVKLLGQQENPYKYMKQCNLFVCSSRFEGLGLVVAEALVLGLPIVCTDCAAKELLLKGDAGLIVENSIEGIYDGIKKLLINTPCYMEYKKKSTLIGKNYNLTNQIKDFEDFFYKKNEVIEGESIVSAFQVTVFTPTYNRAYILDKLYQSLKRQSSQSFEWIIIDDGSTDRTTELVSQWVLEETSFEIIYLKVKNGGKHRAINKGVELARGSLFFIVDSDDYLLDNAIERILYWESTIVEKINYAGVSGNRGYSENQIIGSSFEGDFIDATSLERDKYDIQGDKAEVFYTRLLKKYKFPEIENENFITENVVWNALANEGYKIRWFNEITYITHYLTDGLTYNSQEVARKNPKGYALANERNRKFYLNFIEKEKKNLWDQIKELLINGDLEIAENVLNDNEKVLGKVEEFILLKYQVYLYQGREQDAIEYLEKARRNSPHSIRVIEKLENVYLKRNDKRYLIDLYQDYLYVVEDLKKRSSLINILITEYGLSIDEIRFIIELKLKAFIQENKVDEAVEYFLTNDSLDDLLKEELRYYNQEQYIQLFVLLYYLKSVIGYPVNPNFSHYLLGNTYYLYEQYDMSKDELLKIPENERSPLVKACLKKLM